MSNFVLKDFLIITMLVGFLTSCGDIFMKKETEKEIPLYATCEFDTESLSKILTKNIKGDLDCIKSNLLLFIKIVKTDKVGFLSKKELKKYVENNLKNTKESTISILDAIFDVNSVLFGDDKNYIASRNVEKLVDIFLNVNHYMIEGNVYEYFSTNEKINFKEHSRRKAMIYNSLFKIGENLKKHISKNDKKIDLNTLLDKFKSTSDPEVLDYVSKLLFVKKALLGGEKDSLNSTELLRLASIFGDAGKVAYDFVNISYTETSEDEDEENIKTLKEDVYTAEKNLFYSKDSSEIIFTYEELVDVVTAFFPNVEKYVKYKSSFLKAKEILLGNSSEDFSASELYFIINDILYKNLARGAFFYRSYNENDSILSSAKRIFYNFRNLISQNFLEDGFKEDFNRITQNYRFFHGNKPSAYFTKDYLRNSGGMFEISLFEDLSRRVYMYYGTTDAEVTLGYAMSLDNIIQIMADFKEIFEGEGYILPGRAANTAETITLMATLFLYQSNGDAKIEIPEFVEFIVTMTSSLSFATKMETFMRDRCGIEFDNRVNTACVRDNFLNFLDENIEDEVVKDYMPNLSNYIGSLDYETKHKYIKSVNRFSRACKEFTNGEEIPMSSGDFIVSFAGLFLIEQAMLKLDVGGRENILDLNEVENAFDLYKSAIEGMIPVESLKKYARYFFLYIVKFNSVPELPEFDPASDVSGNWFQRTWQTIRGRLGQAYGALKVGGKFFKFVFDVKVRGKDKDIIADRMTFAAVLEIIAKNSPANKNNPYPCDNLRPVSP